MAITNAQQARQLYKNGKRVGFFSAGLAQGDSISPGTSSQGGTREGGYGRKEGETAAQDMNTYEFNPNIPNPGGTPSRFDLAAANAAAKEKAKQLAAAKEIQRLRDLEAKKEEQLSDLGKSKTTKFGTVKTNTLTPREKYLATLREIDPEAIEGDKSSKLQTAITHEALGQALPPQLQGPIELNERETALKEFLDRRNPVKTFGLSSLLTGPLQQFSDFNASINRPFFEKVIGAGKIPGLDFDMTADQFEDAYQSYMSDRLAGKTDAYGNPTSGYSRDSSGNIIGSGNGGGNNYVPPIVPKKDDDDDDDDDDTTNLGGLAPRFMGSSFDFTGLADGGRAGYMDGGRMMMMANQEEDDPKGGIMDLESGRQMYFLGKLVKKATRAVKKVVKSPIGKAALLYFGGGALGNLAGGSGLGGMFKGAMTPSKFLARSKLSNIFTKGGAKNILFGGQKLLGNPAKNNFVDFSGILGSGGKFSIGKALGLGLGIPTALDLMGVGKEEDQSLDLGPGIDIRAIRNSPYRYLAPRFTGSNYEFADGGRIGYAEGSKEPVAKDTMPLLDMDGMEKDYREDGGFVPIGRMERADDVPARLSKNEFVFTADAVRNAGDGDIDKGAEVMYNMMKNLESGGEVSEESQGLDGAREMFQTSQRLEEVL